jgi:hypothetical protein
MIDLHHLYYQMVDQWQEIVRQPISWAAKQEQCFALLIILVDKLASARVGQPNAPLRFFADMVRLHRNLFPVIANDDLGRIAISPSWHVVGDWLHANASANRAMSISGPINVDRYLDIMQVRAVLIGEQPGFPPLDPVRVNRSAVQAALRRVIKPEIGSPAASL